MLYWAKSSVSDIIGATGEAITNPRVAFERARIIHPQIAHQIIEREIAELEAEGSNAYTKLVNRVGRTGMYGILAMDKIVKTIGINAVFKKAIRDGKSQTEASRLAVQVTLNTQPTANAKNLAAIYQTSEFLNWFTMFTNQLNQLYNIATSDMPAAIRNGHYHDAMRSAVAMGVMAVLIKMISDREFPDEPEDIAAAVVTQAIASVPVVGSSAAGALKGFGPSAPAPLKAVQGAVLAGKAIAEGDADKAVKLLVEPVSVTTGVPFQAVKDVVKFAEEVK